MPDDRMIDAPVSFAGLWPDSDDDDDAEFEDPGEEQVVEVCGVGLRVRQYAYHSHNANRVWPGTFNLAEYYLEDEGGELEALKGCRVLELGSATGLLALRMKMAGVENIVTSDVVDDGIVKGNVAFNFELNGVEGVEHIEHTWGTGWEGGRFKVVICSDILLYVAAYDALVKTLGECTGRVVMSWNRRMEESQQFFRKMEEAGWEWRHEGKCVYVFEKGGGGGKTLM